MLSRSAQLSMLAALAVYTLVLLLMLRRKRLTLRYALLWIFSDVLMLVLAIFPGILPAFAGLLGIYDHTNALFATVFFCLILILMSLTSAISGLNEKVKTMAQSNALLEKRLRELEEREKQP